jgi:hypothetical protein
MPTDSPLLLVQTLVETVKEKELRGKGTILVVVESTMHAEF